MNMREIINLFGFIPQNKALMTNYREYSKGKVFFSEKSGVSFWIGRVEAHAEHNFDDPPPVVVLRVPKAAIQNILYYDAVGSKDSRSGCYYITEPFK